MVPCEVAVAGRRLDLLVPADGEALLDAAAVDDAEIVPYWCELWPSGRVLADTVARRQPAGRIVELGCGLGLPSLAAALHGHDVLATDWSRDAVSLLDHNALRAGVALRTQCWDWSADPSELGGPFDVVLAADVLYEEPNVGQLLAAFPALIAPQGEAWIADPGRAVAAGFFAGLPPGWTADVIDRRGRITIHRVVRAS